MKDRVSKDYRDRIHSSGLIPQYMRMLEQIGLDLQEILPNGLQLYFCKYKALNTVFSYLYDKERYKDFHDSQQPNNTKKAAYFCKWIAKIRPFTVDVDEDLSPDDVRYNFAIFINAYACIFAYQALIDTKTDNLPDSLIYDFHYGAPSSSSLIAMFDLAS